MVIDIPSRLLSFLKMVAFEIPFASLRRIVEAEAEEARLAAELEHAKAEQAQMNLELEVSYLFCVKALNARRRPLF